jgi:hypothetical protein
MEKEILMALIAKIIDSEISGRLKSLQLLSGPRGQRGKSGKDFDFEENKENISSLIDSFITENLPNLKLSFSDLTEEEILSLKGKDGVDGKEGKDFSFHEYRNDIKEILTDYASSISDALKLKFSDLTEEEVLSLKGKDGKDGRNGIDGKDFSFEENKELINDSIFSLVSTLRNDLKLKFSDLTEDDLSKIRGPRGQRGKQGDNFIFEDHKESIQSLVDSKIESLKDSLKLKFSDLSEEEIFSLQGQKGKDGRDGQSFIFEEHKGEIFSQVSSSIYEIKDDLKLKFTDLSNEEVQGLKLKFSDLTDEEVFKLRGPRGQRGRQGKDFEYNEHELKIREEIQAKISSMRDELKLRFENLTPSEKESLKLKFSSLTKDEINLLKGANGINGASGRDGLDAPVIEDVNVESMGKDSVRLVFSMSDGEEIRTNTFQVSKIINEMVYQPIITNGSGGGTATELEVLLGGVSLGNVTAIDFGNLDFNVTVLNGVASVSVKFPSIPSELGVLIDTVNQGTTKALDFDSSVFDVTYDADATILSLKPFPVQVMELGVLIDTVDQGKTKAFDFDSSVFDVTYGANSTVLSLKPITAAPPKISVLDDGVEITDELTSLDFGLGLEVEVQDQMGIWQTLSEVNPLNETDIRRVRIKNSGVSTSASKLSVKKILGENIPAFALVVFINETTVMRADKTFYSGVCDGIILSSGNTGEEREILMFGIVENTGITYPLKTLLLLDSLGTVRTTRPASGYWTIIGRSLGNGSIFIDIKEPELVTV